MRNKYKASSRVREAQQCIRKKRYATEEAAESARIRTSATRWYQCPWCDGFHLTTQLAPYRSRDPQTPAPVPAKASPEAS